MRLYLHFTPSEVRLYFRLKQLSLSLDWVLDGISVGESENLPTSLLQLPLDRGWQRNEGVLLLHRFLSLDILVTFSILTFGTSAKSVS